MQADLEAFSLLRGHDDDEKHHNATGSLFKAPRRKRSEGDQYFYYRIFTSKVSIQIGLHLTLKPAILKGISYNPRFSIPNHSTLHEQVEYRSPYFQISHHAMTGWAAIEMRDF